MKRIIAALAAAFALAGPAAAAPVDAGRVVAELAPQTAGIAPGQTTYVALRQKIDKGWHTYWRNPGDSGEATQIAWSLPPGWTAGEIVWPAPERKTTGPLVNYGYEGEVLLPVPVTAPADAKPGETARLRADVTFLVCADICVPEDAVLELALPVVAGSPEPHRQWAQPIARTLAQAPKPAGLTAAFRHEGQALQLAVTGPPLAGADVGEAYFFPYEGAVIDHAAAQTIERGPQGLTLTLTPGYAFNAAAPPQELAGVLSLGDQAFEVAALQGPAPPGAAGLGPPPARAGPDIGVGLGLPVAILFAFLGGIILNLMPCVFPILAMKAAGLAGHGHEQAAARRHGLVFLAGVLTTFLALAGVLIALQAAGAAVGWGFQLQSPPVVAALALLMLAVALNLSGVFEVGGALQGVGGDLASRPGLAGAFFTGVLAVFVAAPCTAPFMAPAIGWALTQAPAAALAVFLALGLGLAAPFVAVSFAPGLLRRLPPPGPWMAALRRLLAFPMYGAAAWLVWVLTVQAGATALARVLAAAVILALAAWLAGAAQRGRAVARAPRALAATSALLTVVALAGALWPYEEPALSGGFEQAQGSSLAYEPYSPERVAALRAEGRPVFVNFTAAWCVTCQVNERVALASPAVAAAFTRTGAAYLKADWTRKDAEIARELARHGRAGVPLYIVYGPGEAQGRVLPQILTEGGVIRALERAAAPG